MTAALLLTGFSAGNISPAQQEATAVSPAEGLDAIPYDDPVPRPTVAPPNEPGGGPPDGPSEDGLPVGVFVFALLALVVLAGIWGGSMWLRSRSQSIPGQVVTTKGGKASVVATDRRPAVGTPYLETYDRPLGTLYFQIRGGTVSVGRSADNDIIVDETWPGWQTVSRHHALIEWDGERTIIVDQSSTNGIFINGVRTGENLLQDGWVVSFGQVQCTYRRDPKGA